MSFPEIAHSRVPLQESDADALLLALPPIESNQDVLREWPGLADSLTATGFTGASGSVQRAFAPESTDRPLIVVGTGPAPSTAALRDAIGAAIRTTTGFESIAVSAPGVEGALWQAMAEGAAIGGYSFAGYKTDAPKQRAARVIVHSTEDVSDTTIAAANAIGNAVALVKDLVNTPAQWLGPGDFAERAILAAEGLPIDVEVFDEHRLAEEGFGGILGVGQGSDRPPRFIRLDYSPAEAQRHVAIVGKGITFDSGGLSLKPAAGMVGMKYDMCGAATALAVVRAAAQLALPVHVSAWLCVAENMPSGRATRPGDVVRILDGTTVEVLNTDAEGRIVLADGLVAASRTHPDVLIDVATLTGAITVALGTRHAGVMGEDTVVAEYLAAADRAGELAWQMPLPAHMEADLDSPIADLQNAKIGDPAGGSLFAALFLQRFVGRVSDEADAPRIPWIHLDIAGVGMNKGGGFGATDKGPTAASVRSLIEFLAGGTR